MESAKAGEDYEAVFGTVSFAAGETKKTLHVPVLDDDTKAKSNSRCAWRTSPARICATCTGR